MESKTAWFTGQDAGNSDRGRTGSSASPTLPYLVFLLGDAT